ncbi:MAG: hypothetical protein IJE89_01350 [Bacilli bacterium]|nr:hypothetical protein [Bacilli bacterium]
MSKIYDDEFINLNMDFINKTSQNDIRKLLIDRTNNLEHDNFSMDYKRIITITAIDHMVCRMIVNNSPIGIKTKIYLEELDRQLLRQPLLFLSLPIRFMDVNVLRKYLPSIDRIINICRQKKIQAQEINKKIKNGLNVSQEELNILIKYFDYSSTKDDDSNILEAQDRLARYLLNNETLLGLHALSFLVKYFGYKKCRQEKLDNIQILIGDLSSYGSSTYGLSSNKTITLSKDFFVQTSFLGNKLTNEFSKLNNGKLEGLVCLNVLFHELRHAVQDKEHYEKKKTDMSFAMSTRKILHENDSKEYERNYGLYNIESDANQYGWLWTREVIKDYMDVSEKDRLAIYADLYSFKYMIKKVFAAKLDADKKGRFIGCFEKEELDIYFKKYPDSLNGKYSHFRVFYNNDGSPKGLNELIKLNSYSSVDFRTFYANQISARIVTGESLDYTSIDKLPIVDKINILKNFNNIIHTIYRKFSILGLKKTNGNFLYDDLSAKEKRPIIYNAGRYFRLAKMYSDIIRTFTLRYPEILAYTSVIDNINTSLKSINKNQIVNDLLDGAQLELIEISSLGMGRQNGKK